MSAFTTTPVITKMTVVPVAGYDSMLMTLSGAHAPVFTRNLVILKDSAGHTGVGEIHGGDYTCDCLNAMKPLVEGQQISQYRKVLQKIHKLANPAADDDGEGIQTLDISKLKYVVKSEWAIECAMMDLFGQFLGVHMCDLMGEGQQRKEVEMLGYLFYVSDRHKVPAGDMQYLDESDSSDPWFRLRREEILTPERIVEEAEAVREKYGFSNFKLKGGVLAGAEEMEAMKALKKRFPEARVNIDPNGAWSLAESIELCKDMHGIITYMEDPCGPEAGYSSREIMREFKNATQFQVATNMIATDWRQFYHTVSLSNNHFDITLAAFAQVGAAAVGDPAPLDTHWIWQDGQNLLDDAPQIIGGKLQVPDAPGLGVHLNMERVWEANRLYNSLPTHDRDDAKAMQYLIPNWVYDHKKPCLVR